MTTCTYVVCLWLVAGSLTQGQTGPISAPGVVEPDWLLSANEAMADINELSVFLVTRATYASSFEAMANRIGERLDSEGFNRVKRDTGLIPRLVVCVEGTPIPECDKYVYRVQTALHRPVALSSNPPVNLQAEVWRLMPVGGVVARSELTQAVESTVEAQVSAFLTAVQAARQLPAGPGRIGPDAPGTPRPPNERRPQAASTFPFIASKSGAVFHRPDCRWAQNITGANLVGYKDREEAVQAGKRPCKSCNP